MVWAYFALRFGTIWKAWWQNTGIPSQLTGVAEGWRGCFPPMPELKSRGGSVIDPSGRFQGVILAQLGTFLLSHLRRRTSDGRYRPEVDGLRFVAIGVVIVGHLLERSLRTYGAPQSASTRGVIDLLAKPGPGVLLFFAISGFIIASQFLKRPSNPLEAASLKRYFKRRVLRIEPPYIILLVGTFVLVGTTGLRFGDSGRFNAEPHSLVTSFLGSLAYSHGWLFGSMPRLFPPGWSLEIEVQFYLVAPVLFALMFALKLPVDRFAAGMVLLLVSIYIACFVPWSRHTPFTQFTLLLYFPYFWLGVLVAEGQAAMRSALDGRRRVAALLGWAGLAVFLATTLMVHAVDPASGFIYMSGLIAGVLMMFCGVLAPSSSFRSFCALPAVSLIGGQCYSIYLTHLQVLQLTSPLLVRLLRGHATPVWLVAAVALQIIVVLGVGVVFYALIERPFMADDWPRRLAERLGRRPSLRLAPNLDAS